MSDFVREPQQQRSIDKKNRIIEAGYKLFAEKGYFNTNTAEIAKVAGVSTGIVYGYFRDKRDILLDVLNIYIDNVFAPAFKMFDNLSPSDDFALYIPHIIDSTVEVHRQNAAIHEALHSLSPVDKEVNDRFLGLEKEMTDRLVARLRAAGYVRDDLTEAVHLAIETVQSYAHECVYDKHTYIDYSRMRLLLINVLDDMFAQK